MIYVIWCPVCTLVRVPTHDEPCVRCKAAVDAVTDPIIRPAFPPMQPPRLLRFMRWLGGAA